MTDLINRADALAALKLGDTVTALQRKIEAIPAVTNAGVVKVKPLVWRKDGTAMSAKTKVGEYRVSNIHGEWMWFFAWLPKSNEDKIDKGRVSPNTEESAKAAAQADLAARILAAIEITPDPRDAVIARLVEAAESLRSKHDYIMRGCTWSITHMQIAGEFDAALAAEKEVQP